MFKEIIEDSHLVCSVFFNEIVSLNFMCLSSHFPFQGSTPFLVCEHECRTYKHNFTICIMQQDADREKRS
jgi:hypothetical protein